MRQIINRGFILAIGGLLFSLPAMSGVVEMPEIVDVPSGYTINELGEISDLSGKTEGETRDRHV